MKSLMESKNVGEDAVKEEDCTNVHKIWYTCMYNEKVSSIFPNVKIAMRIFLSVMVTNTSGELKFIKRIN
jgi:hypothetical protein